jgi:hypothetical protein
MRLEVYRLDFKQFEFEMELGRPRISRNANP